MTNDWISVQGIVSQGHGVASDVGGEESDGGFIRMQVPRFAERGLDLSRFYPGTINVSIAPQVFGLSNPQYTFPDVQWSPQRPAEDFSFSACRVRFRDTIEPGYVYYPHPETKPAHFQDPSIVEIITVYIDGVEYGSQITLDLKRNEVSIA